MTLISVVMPVRNGERWVGEAIRSIRAQTLADWELIVVDNESVDASVEIARSQAGLDGRIRVLTGVGGGRATAKNVGIAHASGRFIARMDADDVSVPGRFAVQLKWMRACGAAVCGGCAARFGDGAGLAWFPQDHESIQRELLFRSPLLGPTVMARADVLRRHPYSERAAFKDYELWTRLVHEYRLTNVPAVLLKYRCHPAQSHVLESDACVADILTLGGRLFAELFPEADDRDARAVSTVASRAPFSDLNELELAGRWLVRLGAGDDPQLRESMLSRWRDACRRSTALGPATYRTYRRLAPAFCTGRAVSQARLGAAARLRLRHGSRLDTGVRSAAAAGRRLRRAAS